MSHVDFGWAKPKEEKKEIQIPIKIDQFDRAPARREFELYSKEVDKMVARAEKHEVTDDGSYQLASDMGTAAKRLWKRIDEKEKEYCAKPEIVKLWEEFRGSIKSLAAPFKSRLKKIQDTLGEKQGTYRTARELKRREDERRANEALAEQQKKLDEEADKKGLERVQLPSMVMPKEENVTRSESGISYGTEKWDFEVVDIKLVPRERLLVNGELCSHQIAGIRNAIRKQAVREIPGLRIFETTKIKYRT